MATEQALNIITGRTGTAHVSSADDAAIYRGFVGNNNAVLSTDQQLSLDYSTAGTLVVSDGVFCIGGRMGRISNTASVDYSLPSSGNYRRTILLVRYEYDNSDETESMKLMTLQSDPQSDTTEQTGGAASASVLPISVNQETDYVLYDFVCGEDGVVSGTMKTMVTVIDTIPSLRTAVDTVRVNSLTIEKASVTTRGVYFTSLDTSVSIKSFLQNKRVALVLLFDTSGENRLQMLYSPIFTQQPPVPAMVTVNSVRQVVEFAIVKNQSDNDIFLKCMTENNGSYILSPANYPYTNGVIYAWG